MLVQFLEDPLEEGMATQSSILATDCLFPANYLKGFGMALKTKSS